MSYRVFRISLREMLILVALVALAIASLKYANELWLALIAGVTMVGLFIALIVAVVDRGPRQAFAIGLALTMVAYGLAIHNGQKTVRGTWRNIELDQEEGRLPTTRLLRYVHNAVQSSGYFDNATGKELPNYDPAKDSNPGLVMMPGGGMAQAVSFREIPPRDVFMPIGHCWWAMILGYAGGHFARFVYWRRLREEQKLPAETS